MVARQSRCTQANFAAGETNLAPRAFFRHELRGDAGRAAELPALALLQLDVVDRGAERDGAERKAVARLDVGVAARDDGVAHLDAVGREDVALLAVDVVEEGDARGAVGIVFDRGDLGGNADLLAAKVDDAVALLVTAAAEAAGDAPVVVAPAGASAGARAGLAPARTW